ncbi:MAG: GntR family transcriptional regulator [Anaerolineae bacterium]|nr:GntR family transcriptional regulator [Anaerolineae bacterium]
MAYKIRGLVGSSNLSEQTASILRDAIKSGEIEPNTHLVEQDIANQLGISRIPVRKAIETLIEERLVVKDAHKGAFVHPYSKKELEEVYSIRILLEHVVVERVLANWSAERYEQLKTLVDRMAEVDASTQKQSLDDLDTLFHETLWAMAEHNILAELLAELRSRSHIFYFLREQSYFTENVGFLDSHRSLLAALNSGSVAEAKAEMTRHIEKAKHFIENYYAYLDE